MIRAALYERVSTEQQALHGYSIQAQVDALTDYCAAHQIKVVGHYTDEGVSGGKPTLRRPAMLRLLHDVEAGLVDMVLFTKLDRWFRNVKEYYKTQDILDRHHVTWKTILQDYDTSTANGSFMVTVMLGIAEQERLRTSERIRVVFDNKVRNGEAIVPRSSVPLGYIKTTEDGRPVLRFDPATHDAVAAFWATAISTGNISAARQALEDAGVYRSYTQCRDMIAKNRFYTGTYRGIPNYCPAYLTDAQLADIRSHGVKSAQRGRVYILSGLVRCPVCGNTLKSCANSYTRLDGTRVEYNRVRCLIAYTDPQRCTFRRYLTERLLQEQLLDHLAEYLSSSVSALRISHAAAQKKAVDPAALRERQRRLTTAYLAGAFTDDEYRTQLSTLTAQIAAAEQTTPAPLPDTTSLERLIGSDYRTLYSTLTPAECQRFWHSLIQSIHVSGSTITSVDFKFD